MHKTEIKPEHYRCENCQTDYFLDNDDININVTHQGSVPSPTLFHQPMVKIAIIGGLLFFALIIYLLFVLLTPKPTVNHTPTQNTVQSYKQVNSPTTTSTPVSKKEPKIYYNYCATVIADNVPYILTIEDHQLDSRDHQFYFVTYDLLNNKVAKKRVN